MSTTESDGLGQEPQVPPEFAQPTGLTPLPPLAPVPGLPPLPPLASPQGAWGPTPGPSGQATPAPVTPPWGPSQPAAQPVPPGRPGGMPPTAPVGAPPQWPSTPSPYASPYASPSVQAPREPSKAWWLVGAAVIVGLALIVWALTRGAPQPGPGPVSTAVGQPSQTTGGSSAPVTPSQAPTGPTPTDTPPPFTDSVPDYRTRPQWSPAHSYSLPGDGYLRDVFSAGWGDVVIMAGIAVDSKANTRDTTLQAVDLSTMDVLWTYIDKAKDSDQAITRYYVDPSGIVLEKLASRSDTLQIIDPRTGAVFASAQLGSTEEVRQVVAGWIVTDNFHDYCIRPVRAPQSCQYSVAGGSFRSLDIDNQPVFGGGRWMNTASGVIDLATGKAAGFGADAHSAGYGSAEVRYAGESPDRVFRVQCSQSDFTKPPVCSVQPWDVATNKSLGPSVEAGMVKVTPDGKSFVGITAVDDGSFQTARYSWPDGKQIWQGAVIKCEYGYCPLSRLSASVTGQTLLLKSALGTPLAVSLATGASLAFDDAGALQDGVSTLIGGDQVVYATDGRTMIAYDGASGKFDKLWSLTAPHYMTLVAGAGHHVVGIDDGREQMYVLQPS